ncbi:hypothetical protein PG997_010800 [Apiospora hydei]|uniref:Heterokaryon incompatibility domain-containing protein n=1 Tax=Apiospora hydei TaxID=1337664 RepID=A0ABR1VI87_9PEZI
MSLDLPVCAADRPPTVVVPYAYRPLEQSQVRLLTLYPGEEPDEIRIRLRYVKLRPDDSGINASSEFGDQNLPEYEALSYTWGTSYSRRQRVLVETDEGGGNNDNRQFMLSITDNLAEAMRRIRHNAATAKTLWVDALCINQADKAEKSIQVPLMTVIYRSAARVLVWLGPERDDSALAMRLIGFTGARVEVDWSSYSYTGFDADYLAGVETEFGMVFSDPAFVASVGSLLEREWFKRVWVRQEVFLARQAVSFCGMSEMGWVDFRKGALVLAFEFFDTHDAGLPEVDYSLSTAEVYTATATHIFRNADALHMLMACELAPNRMANLPSWVPDWSTSSANAHFYSGSHAATNTIPSVEFPRGAGGVMRLPGVMRRSSKVKAFESMGSLHSEATEAIIRILRMVPSVDEEYMGGNESFGHALCCAVYAGHYRHCRIPQLPGDVSFGETRRAAPSGKFVWEGRGIFLTEDGHVGLGPLSTSPGDSLFFPWGSSFPVLMRPAPATGELNEEVDGPRQYFLVGPCYVTGLMSGEILYGPLPSDYCVVGRQANERGHWRSEIHKMVIQGDEVVSTERDVEYEKERVRRPFGELGCNASFKSGEILAMALMKVT